MATKIESIADQELISKKTLLKEKQEEMQTLEEQIIALEQSIRHAKKINLERVGSYERNLRFVNRQDFLGLNLKIDEGLFKLIKKAFHDTHVHQIHVKKESKTVVKNTVEVTMMDIIQSGKVASFVTIENIIATSYDLITKEKADQGPLYNIDFSVSKSLHIGFIKHEGDIYDVWLSRKRHGHDPSTLGREFILHWEKDPNWIYFPNTESLI
jgi:hypothetical protein